MSFFKYIERMKLIHSYLEKGHTGNGEEFARKIGISRSVHMEHIQELRETFNAPIDFSRREKTFYYTEPFKMNIEITCEKDKNKIRGGLISFYRLPSESTGLIDFYITNANLLQ
ncbi:MAG: hypothetical protein WAZ98_14720 [Cyclobacteriaceae bacterium]